MPASQPDQGPAEGPPGEPTGPLGEPTGPPGVDSVWGWLEDPGVDHFEGLNLKDLKIDQAYVRVKRTEVNNETDSNPLWLYQLSDDCHECPYSKLAALPDEGPTILRLNVARGLKWRVYPNGDNETQSDPSDSLCYIPASLGQAGVYDLNINESSSTCQLQTAREPANTLLPLGGIVIGLLALAIIHGAISMMCSFCERRRRRKRSNSSDTLPKNHQDVTGVYLNGHSLPASASQVPVPVPPMPRRRVHAVDTFRGIAIIFMLIVNDGAGGYWFFEHATWDGLFVADVLFPWFIWIMGVCIPLSISSQLAKNVSRTRLLGHVLKRSILLFLLGVAVSNIHHYNLESIRIMGVLQRFGVVYLIVGTSAVLLTRRRNHHVPSKGALRDVTDVLPQWIIALLFAGAHVALTLVLPVPDCPSGYTGPGGIHKDGLYKNCTGGAAGYIDRFLLGENHLYGGLPTIEIYKSSVFDPEGLMGCLTSVFQAFLGIQAGSTLRTFSSTRGRITRWAIWGLITGLAGLAIWLAVGIPLNKSLWSISFVLLTSSLAFFLLCVCYLLVDVWGCWSGSPFIYPGMNALVVYVGHMICSDVFPFHWSYGPMNKHYILMLETLWGALLWILISVWLYKKKIFISL